MDRLPPFMGFSIVTVVTEVPPLVGLVGRSHRDFLELIQRFGDVRGVDH
jgi:hypothetical protein